VGWKRGGEGRFVRRFAPIDELDDLGPPPPLPLIRFCGAPGCRRRARPGGRHCPGCHTAAVRRWREEHRRELAVRRRDAAAARDDDARARDSGRAKLAMALRRGTLERGRCRECGAREVVGLIADPADWRAVMWVCREHRKPSSSGAATPRRSTRLMRSRRPGTMSGRGCLPRSSFFPRLSGRSCTRSRPEGQRARRFHRTPRCT